MTTRVLDTADLATAFTQAQAGLAAAPAGSAETWVLGPGEFDLGDGISAGAPGRSLTLRGTATLTVGSAAPVAAPATGLDLTGADVRVDGLTLRVRSAGTATALRVRAAGRCELTDLNVDAVEGTTAVGVDAAAAGELSLLDVRVAHVGGTQDATGVVTACAGDVAVRGLTVDTVDGARACGAVIVAGREADWSGGRINAVRATAGGAVGLRVLAAPERAAIRLTDLAVAQVSGTDPGTVAEPAESWRTWLADAGAALAAGAGLPDWPATGDPGHAEAVAGLHICAPVPEDAPWLQTSDPGPVEVTQCVVERISGTAVQVTADLRNIELRGLLIWTAARAGHVEGERVLLAQSTIHRVGFGWTFGPCALTAADTLVTGVQSGPGVVLGPEAELVDALVVIATAGLPPWEPEPTPLPYHDPGPGGVPAELLAGDVVPDAAHDLRVDGALHGRAQPVPGDDDDAAAWVGALAPDVDTRCALRDPAPPPTEPAPAPQAPGPVVDYRARDARSLLALMTARARLTMPGWTPTGPADQTQMLLELFAERLDRIAYRQELALSEGTVATALERRSVEDHVRLVDYVPDPGLSASTMLRFKLSDPDAATLDALAPNDILADTAGPVVIAADTLVLNPDAADRVVVFGTESDLTIVRELDTLQLADETNLEPGVSTAIEIGDTSAVLAGALPIEPGRWLVIAGVDPLDPTRLDPDVPGHVVRVTQVQPGTDTTRVLWDPRRGSPTRYERDRCRVFGNVVPAHHSLPLTGAAAQNPGIAVLEQDDVLAPWRERLRIEVDGSALREVPVPIDRVSVHAAGWPFPGGLPRIGEPRIELAVEHEPWTRVDDLASAGDQVFALRTGPGDTPVVRFARNALPARPITVDLAVRVGLGTVGNVGVGALTRLLALGPGEDTEALLGDGGTDRYDLLRRLLTVTNPVPGVGGRDPEDLETMRYRAPLGVRDALSAVVPADYERLVSELPEVAASRAVVRGGPLAPVITTTLLLRDEDGLAEAGEQGEAERLRRWAAARARLEEVRLLGFDVELVPPRFVPLDVDVVVDVDEWALDTAEFAVQHALGGPDGLFDPDVGGLGGDVHVDAIHRRVLAVPGVQAVRIRHLRRLQPDAAEHARTGRLAVDPDEVAILRHPYGAAFPSGLLTVTVCEAQP